MAEDPANLPGGSKAAMLSHQLSTTKRQNGRRPIRASTDAWMKRHTETYGSLSKSEKIKFILELIRLALEKDGCLCSHNANYQVGQSHVTSIDVDTDAYKTHLHLFMEEYHSHENDAYELSKDYLEIYSTHIQMINSGLKDKEINMKEETKDSGDAGNEEKWMPALQATVLFLALSQPSPKQYDALRRIATDGNLKKNVVCHDIVHSLLNKYTKRIRSKKCKKGALDVSITSTTVATMCSTIISSDDTHDTNSGCISCTTEKDTSYQNTCRSGDVSSGCVVDHIEHRLSTSARGISHLTPDVGSSSGSVIYDGKELLNDDQDERYKVLIEGRLGDGGGVKRSPFQSLPYITDSNYDLATRSASQTFDNHISSITLSSDTDPSSSQNSSSVQNYSSTQTEPMQKIGKNINNNEKNLDTHQCSPSEHSSTTHRDGESITAKQNINLSSSSSVDAVLSIRSPQQSLWIQNALQYEKRGNYASALYYYELYLTQLRESNISSKCEDLMQESEHNFKTSVSHVIEMVWILHKVGVVRWKAGEYNTSLTPLTEASSRLRNFHLNSKHGSEARKVCGVGLVEVLNSMGRIYMSRGQHQQARMLFEESFGILNDVHVKTVLDSGGNDINKFSKNEHKNEYDNGSCNSGSSRRLRNWAKDIASGMVMQPSMAQTIIAIGMVDAQQGKYSKALQKYKMGYYIQRQILCADHVDIAASLNMIGNTHGKMYKYSKAMKYHKKALKMYTNQLGNDHIDVAVTKNYMGEIYFSMGNLSKSMDAFSESLRATKSSLGESHRNVASLLHNIALIHTAWGEFDTALLILKNVLKSQRKALGDNHIDVALTLESIGDAYEQKGRPDRGIKLYKKALRIRRSAYGPSHIFVALTLDRIGKSLMSDGKDLKEAMCRFHEALNLYHLNGVLNEDERVVLARNNLQKIRNNLYLSAKNGMT